MTGGETTGISTRPTSEKDRKPGLLVVCLGEADSLLMKSAEKGSVVVLGASDKPERYSYRAVEMLLEHGYEVIPVHPVLAEVQGLPVVSSVEKITTPVDTVSVYVNPKLLEPMTEDMVALKPRRVIFNPGTESTQVVAALEKNGIEWENACTLVLLQTNQF